MSNNLSIAQIKFIRIDKTRALEMWKREHKLKTQKLKLSIHYCLRTNTDIAALQAFN